MPKGCWRLSHEIVLESRRGREIPNAQQYELSAYEKNSLPLYEKLYPAPEFTHRSKLNPVYNCHGMTFASRRTWVHDTATIRQILEDDCYSRVDEADALPGDVVLYVAEDGDVEHSGIVVREKKDLDFPLICSKWGKWGEVIHPVHRSPYSAKKFEYYRVSE